MGDLWFPRVSTFSTWSPLVSDRRLLLKIDRSSFFFSGHNKRSDLRDPDEIINTYLLLTEFEVRTASYGPSFFPFDL